MEVSGQVGVQKECKHFDEYVSFSSKVNFCHDHGNALKPATVQDCNRQMGYVEKSDHMAIIPLEHAPGNG
jgi:hypothetical protein